MYSCIYYNLKSATATERTKHGEKTHEMLLIIPGGDNERLTKSMLKQLCHYLKFVYEYVLHVCVCTRVYLLQMHSQER